MYEFINIFDITGKQLFKKKQARCPEDWIQFIFWKKDYLQIKIKLLKT
jgi:hypothetical protein